MNKAYKVIWSNARKCYVVVSEIARNHGKNNTRSIVSRLGARMQAVALQMASVAQQAFTAGGQPVIHPRTAARWIVPLVLAGMVLPGSAWATTITKADSNIGAIDVKGNVYDVYTQRVSSDKKVGINQFKEFKLDAGHTANMHFNQKGQSAYVNDLVNLVDNRIEINGMVNAVKSGKIDGNLYFLSPDGMEVGASGVINAGRFVAMTPGSAYWFKLWDRPENVVAAVKDNFAKFGVRETEGDKAGQFKASGVELGEGEDITIKGKINTRSGIVLGAGKIAIQNGAVLQSQKDIDFNNLVNAANANLPSGDLNVTTDKSGDIILRSETSYKYENSPIPIGTSFENGFSNISEYVAALTNMNSSAEVAVDGQITGDGNVDISAASSTTFTNKNWPGISGVSDIGKEFLNRLGLNIDADVVLKYNKAAVSVGKTGKVSAGGDASMQADATVNVKMQSKTVSKKDAPEDPAQGPGTSTALPVIAVAWGDMENSALVDVKGALSAGGDMNLKANADTVMDLKATATTEKRPTDKGNFAYVSAAVLSGDSVAEVNVEEYNNEKLQAGGDFSAEADVKSTVAAEAIAGSTNDTLATTSVAVIDYDSAANVNLKRSVEAESVTATANNEMTSMGVSADNSAGEGQDPFIQWKFNAGNAPPSLLADWLKGKVGDGFRQGGSLAGFENAFSNALQYVTAGAGIGVVTNANTANVTVAPGVELKATGDAVKKDAKGNVIKDKDGKPVPGGGVTLEATTELASFTNQVAGELNKQGTAAEQDSTVNVSAAVLFSDIKNNATVELQSNKGKGATLISRKGDVTLNARVNSDNENMLSTLRGEEFVEVWEKFLKDGEKIGLDLSKFVTWKSKTEKIQKQLDDGSITEEEADWQWYEAIAGLYDGLSSIPPNLLTVETDLKKTVTALSDIVSPSSWTNYYVRSYTVDGQDTHGSNYDIAASVNFAWQENKGIVAIGEKSALTAGKNINIKSQAKTDVISATGNAGEYLAFSETNGTGVGASIAWQDISADGLVLVGKNVNMKAGSEEDKTEGNITLNGGTDVFELGIINSAGKADRSEWNGTFNLQNGGGNSLVLVDDEATLDATGKVSLDTLNAITVTNVSGGLALGSAKSKFTVGAGVSVNWLDMNSLAVIGDNGKGAATEITDTDTEEFEKKSAEEQNRIIADNNLAAARKVMEERGMIRKMDREFEDSETKVADLLGEATKGSAKGSVTGKDIAVKALTGGAVNAVAVEGVSNSENHAGFDLINKVSKRGAQYKSDLHLFAQGVLSTPENITTKLYDKVKNRKWQAVARNQEGFQPIPQNMDAADNGFNAALAGSVSLNHNDVRTASVINKTSLALRKQDDGKGGALVTEALDDSFTGAWSGAAAMNWFTGGTGVASNNAAHKGSLGAAFSANLLHHNVDAQIRNADISNAGLVEAAGIRNGAEAAAALGLAVTNDSQGTGTNGAVTFGLSVNDNTSGAHALLIDNKLTNDSENGSRGGTDINIRAYDGDIQVAGGVDLSFANSADAGRAIAAGITVSASEITNDMRSGIQGGSYSGLGSVTVAGEDALTQVNTAVGIGITTSAHAFDVAGTLALAQLTNTNSAFISGTEKLEGTGAVSVTSRDISGTKDNPYKAYLEKRQEDPTGNSYLSEETKKKLGADTGSAIVNVAVDIAGGRAAAAGAGVAAGNLSNVFSADITNNKNVEADTVKAGVNADTNVVAVGAGVSVSTEKWSGAGSFALNLLTQESTASITGNRGGNSGIKANEVSGTAKNDSDVISVTGDFAIAKGSSLGLGASFNYLENTAGVYVGNNVISAKEAARGVDVSAAADNNAYELALSAGAAVNYAQDNNLAAEGNFAVNLGHNNTIAVIGEDKAGKKGSGRDTITNASSVKATATDKTQRTTIAGDVDVAWKGAKVALGIGVALTESERDSDNSDETTNKERLRAEINNSDITTVKKGGQGAVISAETSDTSQATTVAAGVGITKTSLLGAQGIGADANILKANTAGLHDTTIDNNATDKGAMVKVKATTASTIKTGAAALQLSGENTWVTGVVAVGVNRIKDDTTAEITYGEKQETKSINAGNVDISAASQADILSVAAGASGTWKGSAAIGGSGSHNYIANNVAAKIEKANMESAGNMGVVARSDEAISNYAGVLDVALQGSSLSASIGVTGANNEISGKTEALVSDSRLEVKGSDSNKIKINGGLKDDDTYLIDGPVTRNTWSAGSFTEGEGDDKKYGVSRLQKGRKEEEKTGLAVDASATHSISSVMANGGVAVNMGGGGAGGAGGGGGAAGTVAGVVNLNEVGGATTARILDTVINQPSRTRSDVTVHAADYTNVAEFSAAAAIGVAQNGAVGAGFTGADNEINRVTAAGISSSETTIDDKGVRNVPKGRDTNVINRIAAKNVTVTADAKQALSAFNVAGAIAGSKVFSAETGDNVNNNKLASSTIAAVTNTELNYMGKAKVEAAHEDAVYDLNVDAGAAISPTADGIALSLNVGVGVVNEESLVTADVENSLIYGVEDSEHKGSEFSLGATNSTKLEATLVSAGAAVSPFSGGLAASVAVNNIETQVTGRIADTVMHTQSIDINTENKLTVKDRTGTGAGALIAGVGVGVDVNTFNDSVSTIIENSKLEAADKLAITTQSQRDIDTTVAGADIGIGEIGVNVLVVTVADGLGDTDDIKENKDNKGSFSHKEVVNKTLEKVKERVNADLSEHFYGMTDEEVKNMKEKMKTDANTGDGITGAGVHTYVRNNSQLNASDGDVTIINNDYNDAELNGGVGGLAGVQVNVADTLYHLNQQNDIDVDNSAITGKSVILSALQANKKDSEEAIRVRTVQAGMGAIGVGVGYAGIVTKGETGVSVNKGTLATTDGDLEILSKDTAKSKAWVLGVDVTPGAGVLVTVANNEDKANNYVIVEGGSSLKTVRKQKTETVTVQDEDGTERKVTLDRPGILRLTADRAGRTAAKNLGVGVATLSVIVNNTYAEDEGNATVSVNGSNGFTADRIEMKANNAPVLKAEAGGTGVSLVGVTVMNSTASTKSQAAVTVADNNMLWADNVEAKAVVGEAGKDMTHAVTTSTGVELLAGVAPSTAEASTGTTAKVEVGKATYKTIQKEVYVLDEYGKRIVDEHGIDYKTETVTEAVTDLTLASENNASRRSVVDNFNLGLIISVGSGISYAYGDDKSFAEAKGGDVNNLSVSAGGSGLTSGFANGGSGGFIDIGAISNLTLDTKTTNTATLSGVWNVSDLAKVSANPEVVIRGTSKTGAGGFFTVDWSHTDNDATMDTKAVLAKGTVLNAGRSNVKAANTLKMDAYDNETYMNHMNIGGIINISRDTESNVKIDTKANVEVGENSKVTTKEGQIYDAFTDLTLVNKVEGKGGGMLGENVFVYSNNDVTTANGISVGKNTSLDQDGGYDDGDLVFSASDNLNMETVGESYVGALGGASSADAVTKVDRSNKVKVEGTLRSGHDINLYAGADVTGTAAVYTLKTAATAHNNTLIGVYTDPAVKYDRTSNQQVEIGSGANATAIRNINILAGNGQENVKREASKKSISTGWSEETGDEILAVTGGNSNLSETDNNFVKVDGSLKTGLTNKAIITISGNALPKGLTPTDGTKEDFAVSTEGSSIDITPKMMKTGDMDYATHLGNQLAAVEELIEQYGTGSGTVDTAAYYGYVQQRQRILEDLAKHGLVEEVEQVVDGEKKTVRIVKTGGLTVRYVEIPEILVSGGNIVIDAANLTGTGKMDAGGKPEVKITNRSNAYLRLDGARVGDPGGEVFFRGTGAVLSSVATNDDVNKLNKNKNSKAAFTELKVDAASGEVSAIMVDNDNDAKKEIGVKDGKGNAGVYRPVTDVAVMGDLRNDSGEVIIENTDGDITIGSASGKGVNIIGRTVRLKATGSISQDYVDGIVDIGGRPYQLYSQEVEDAKKATEKKDISKDLTDVKTGLPVKETDVTQASAGRIAGGNIYISAADINVNGLIQSGFSRYEAEVTSGNNEADIMNMYIRKAGAPKDADKNDERYYYKYPNTPVTVNGRTLYKVNNGGRMVYDESIGAFKYIVQVYYDPQSKNLVVEDIDTQGGRIYLSGRIASTGQGKILAMDGGADISIINNSKLSMQTGKILNNDTEGRISITDVAKDTWTEYTRSATNSMSLDAYGKYLALSDADKEKFAALTDAGKAEMLGYKTEEEKKRAAISFGQPGIGYNKGATPSGTYQTKKDQRYNWTLGSETGTTKKYYRVDTSLFWDLYEKSDTSSLEQYEIGKYEMYAKSGNRTFKEGLFIGEIPEDDRYKDLKNSELGYVYENRITSKSRTYTASWLEDWWDLGIHKEWHLQWTTKTGSTQSLTFSLKADKDIGIGFLGKENGTIEVKNQLGQGLKAEQPVDLILGGNIVNSSADGLVSFQADKGSIIQKGNTSITTGNVRFSAQDNIDNIHITSLGTRTENGDGTYTASDGVKLYAQSNGGGNVDVDVVGGTVEGQALPGDVIIYDSLGSYGAGVTGKPGNVELTAEGNITQKGTETTVRGLRVTLASSKGGIGTADQDIVLDTPAEPYGMSPDTAAVNASARDSIYLREKQDDMRVGSIVSREGDVRLTAETGRLLDALPEEERTNNWDENDLVKRWIDEGLIAGTPEYKGAYITGLEQDKAKFENNVKEQYALCFSGEASDQVKEVYMKKEADGTWTFKYDSAQAYLDELLKQQSGKEANYYQHIVETLNNPQYKWTKEQLLYAIRYAIVNKETGVNSETQKKVANVQGRNVTLTAKGVGMYGDKKTTILARDISGGSDAAIANLKLLANADADDVTMYDATKNENILRYFVTGNGEQVLMGFDAADPSKALYILKQVIDKDGKKTLKAYDANDPTKELENTEGMYINKFVIGNLSPLGVKATGQLNVTAYGDNAFIAGRSDERGIFSPINAGRIDAVDQDVRLYTQEGIYSVLKGIDEKQGNIHAKNLIAYGGLKDIGASDKYLGVALSGDLLTAAADGSIYIKNVLATEANGVLRVGSLFAGDTIALDSSLGITMTQNPNYALAYLNAGKQLQLVTDGSAGSEETPLRILNSGGEISLVADSANLKGVNGLLGEGATMKLGKITAVNLAAESEGKLETAKEITVGNAAELSANSDITLDSAVTVGTLSRVGGPVTLTSRQGSITETENGVLKAYRVDTTTGGGVMLTNEQNAFRFFTANGIETGEQDADGNPVKTIGGSVKAHAHAGENFETAINDTVYGDVELKNLDAGSLTVTKDITAKSGKVGETGSVTVEAEGDLNLVERKIQADKDVTIRTRSGEVRLDKSAIQAGRDIIAISEGGGDIVVHGTNIQPTLVANNDIALGALAGNIIVEGTMQAARDVTMLSHGGDIQLKNKAAVTALGRDVNISTDGLLTLDGDITTANTGAVTASGGKGVRLNGNITAGNLNRAGDGNTYTGGSPVMLKSENGSIIQSDSTGGIRARKVTTASAGEVKLVNNGNMFSSFAAEGIKTDAKDAKGNPVREINGNVTVYAHGGSSLDAGIADTVRGNVELRNLDSGSLTLTSDITAKKGKNGEGGAITFIQQGAVVSGRALNADRDINIRTENGSVLLLGSVKADSVATKTTDGMIIYGDVRANNDVLSETENGQIVYSGDVRANVNITAMLEK